MSDTDSNEYDSDEVSVEEEVVVEVKKKRGKKTKDPNKPKRNMSSFFLYSQAHRADVKASNPDAAFGDIVSEVGASIVPLFCHFQSILCIFKCCALAWIRVFGCCRRVGVLMVALVVARAFPPLCDFSTVDASWQQQHGQARIAGATRDQVHRDESTRPETG